MMKRDEMPDAPPSAEEIALAEELRAALGDATRAHAGADFARSVAVAHRPGSLGDETNRAIVEASIARADARARRARARRWSFGITTGLAMAAAFAIVVSSGGLEPAPVQPAPMARARARSTQPLFHEPFGRSGGESARIDRIASARGSDLRDNRFAEWGVR
jgi:hypothetical protein